MRIVHRAPLPACWTGHPLARGIVGECDIRLTKTSKLTAKLLVFDSNKNLRAFWKDCLGSTELGTHCKGAVNAIAREAILVDHDGVVHRREYQCDPRFFCVIGLLSGYKTKCRGRAMEIVTHEAVHAAYAYEKRRRRKMWANAADLDEENIAYPAGILATAINRFMHDRDLY